MLSWAMPLDGFKVALIFAGSWGGVLGARVIDRVGEGHPYRSQRTLLVSEMRRPNHMGKRLEIHKALDMAGSAIGIFIIFLCSKTRVKIWRTQDAVRPFPLFRQY